MGRERGGGVPLSCTVYILVTKKREKEING